MDEYNAMIDRNETCYARKISKDHNPEGGKIIGCPTKQFRTLVKKEVVSINKGRRKTYRDI